MKYSPQASTLAPFSKSSSYIFGFTAKILFPDFQELRMYLPENEVLMEFRKHT